MQLSCRIILLYMILKLSMTFCYGVSLPVGSIIVSSKFINIYNDIYSFVITKDGADRIKGRIIDNAGNQAAYEYNFGVITNINSAYILPIDASANQNVTKVLLFLSTVSGLERIVDISLSSAPAITATTNVYTNPSPNKLLVYSPQVLYRDQSSYFLILPYQNSMDIYSYTYNPPFPAIPSIALSRTVNFSGETIKQVLPLEKFVIVVTENNASPPNGYAHFIALSVDKEFAIVNLSSVDDVYLTYDPATQKTLLKTATDSNGVEIQDVPMPYGVIGMQSVQ
ncbi:hypothetical protein [Cysteiniphilum halobium]|uniref:hypothetical protein n=1 Tax=Cysteiniphilum halobium TaxID=2219059 RepID=UPI000E64BE57|nr:hypothetical protein [Cysteiniphilum halobium]